MAEFPGRRRVEARLGRRLVMVAPEAHKAYGLAAAVRGLRVLTRSVGAPAEALRRLGAEVVSVAGDDGHSTTFRLVDSQAGRAALSAWAPALVVVFRPDLKTQKTLEALGGRMVSAAPAVARELENKRTFRRLCAEVGLPTVPFREIHWPPDAATTRQLSKLLGPRRVVQTARGYAGRRTWLWSDGELPVAPSWLDGRPVLVSPFLTGTTWTANAVVGPGGVRVGFPMAQIDGDPRLHDRLMASAGVAFDPPGAAEIAWELERLAIRVGEVAGERGFRGFFGIDAVGRAGELQLLEMNARLTATLTVATLAELDLDRTPLMVSHVLACLDETGDGADWEPIRQVEGGGHLIGRRTAPEPADASSGKPEIELGTYRLGGSALVRTSEEAGWPPADQVTIWPAGPSVGGPEDEHCRLLFSSPMKTERGGFTPFVDAVVEWMTRPSVG